MRRKRNNELEEMSFWQSYSDMMAALLLVFVLIIATAKFSYDRTLSQNEEMRQNLEQQLAENEEFKKKLIEQEELLKVQREKMEEQQQQIDQIIGVRTEIIERLKKKFSGTDMAISVDPETGAISFDAGVLFDFNKHALKDSGIAFLNKFFPMYFETILGDDFRDYIAEVIIEGHTDDAGSYLYNLQLSQSRAFAVAEYCLGENNKMFSGDQLKRIRKLVTANGRSNNDLIYKADNKTVDRDASRRVEIKFRLTEEEMIQQMSQILEENEDTNVQTTETASDSQSDQAGS